MSGLLTKILSLPVHFPLIRGMLSYAIIWPSCSLVQEYIEHGTSLRQANWARAARFSFFGTFFMAPVFYGWMRYSSRFFKRKDFMTAISRAAIEQVTYSPLAMAYFFFGMSMLEGKPYRTCAKEVRDKFWPTYKIGMVFWPTAQTMNFYFVSEKNRLVFVSAASFIWTVYLAHMQGKEQKGEKDHIPTNSQFLNVEPISKNLNPNNEDFQAAQDKAHLIAVEIVPDLMTDQNPIIEINGNVENVADKPVLVVERNPGEKKADLVSDVHTEGFNNLVIADKPVLVVEKSSDEKQPDLVSNVHTEGFNDLVIDGLSQSTIENSSGESSEDDTSSEEMSDKTI